MTTPKSNPLNRDPTEQDRLGQDGIHTRPPHLSSRQTLALPILAAEPKDTLNKWAAMWHS